MGKLVIHQNLVTAEKAAELAKLCPFDAISYDDGKLDISSGCKLCKMCVLKGGGLVEYVEEAVTLDKSLWKGICVYADCSGGKLHRVTFELCGKAKELAAVTGHPVYALLIGHNTGSCAETLRHYGVDKIFVYDHLEFADFDDQDPDHYGLAGSATQVERIFPPEKVSQKQILDGDPDIQAQALYDLLLTKKML